MEVPALAVYVVPREEDPVGEGIEEGGENLLLLPRVPRRLPNSTPSVPEASLEQEDQQVKALVAPT